MYSIHVHKTSQVGYKLLHKSNQTPVDIFYVQVIKKQFHVFWPSIVSLVTRLQLNQHHFYYNTFIQAMFR